LTTGRRELTVWKKRSAYAPGGSALDERLSIPKYIIARICWHAPLKASQVTLQKVETHTQMLKHLHKVAEPI
jgi:hypothetical protein